jgi:hypothetical protein
MDGAGGSKPWLQAPDATAATLYLDVQCFFHHADGRCRHAALLRHDCGIDVTIGVST